MISNTAIKINLLLGMRFNKVRLTNWLQKQQIWSLCFIALVIWTWKQLMASYIVVLDSLGGKAIHVSTLRQKSSSKVIRSIGTLLLISTARLIFLDGGIDWYQQS